MTSAKPRAKRSPITRARTRSQADARAVRVDRVIAMMSDGTWAGLRSHRELAAKWGCSASTVADYATEAHGVLRRLLAMTPEQREAARATLLARLEHIERVALERQGRTGDGVSYDNPDVRGAVSAIDLRAKLLGAYEPTKIDLVDPPEADVVERAIEFLRERCASDAELAARVLDRLAKETDQ